MSINKEISFFLPIKFNPESLLHTEKKILQASYSVGQGQWNHAFRKDVSCSEIWRIGSCLPKFCALNFQLKTPNRSIRLADTKYAFKKLGNNLRNQKITF